MSNCHLAIIFYYWSKISIFQEKIDLRNAGIQHLLNFHNFFLNYVFISFSNEKKIQTLEMREIVAE